MSSITSVITNRWSPKSFSAQQVSTETLKLLFSAAGLAPSSYNEQPWQFVVATKDDPENHTRLAECLVEVNRSWAASAPVLVLAVTKRTLDLNGQPNRYAWHDLGLATANLLAQATALGLHSHVMGGFNPSRAQSAFDIPDDYEPVSVIALGYPGDETQPQRQRKPVEEIVFTGIWDQPLFPEDSN